MTVFALNTSGKTGEPVAYVGTSDNLDTILDGAQVVVLNPAPSALDEVAHQVLKGTAATLLPQLLDD